MQCSDSTRRMQAKWEKGNQQHHNSSCLQSTTCLRLTMRQLVIECSYVLLHLSLHWWMWIWHHPHSTVHSPIIPIWRCNWSLHIEYCWHEREVCVYIVNTLKGIKPKEYKGVLLTSFKCIEVDVHQQTNGTDCVFMCCYYVHHIMKSRIPSESVSSLIRYDADEYHSFISHLISSFNLVKKLCEGRGWRR